MISLNILLLIENVPITATQINYYHVCKRKLWLFSNGLNMEHTSETVAEGKLIGKTTYPQRSEKYTEIEIEGCKIDFYDPRQKVVHEIKKSDKIDHAHIAQVKYYLFLLEKNGVSGVTGVVEYPKLRKTETVVLTETDKEEIHQALLHIPQIIEVNCPQRIKKSFCRNCSYFDFCWIEE